MPCCVVIPLCRCLRCQTLSSPRSGAVSPWSSSSPPDAAGCWRRCSFHQKDADRFAFKQVIRPFTGWLPPSRGAVSAMKRGQWDPGKHRVVTSILLGLTAESAGELAGQGQRGDGSLSHSPLGRSDGSRLPPGFPRPRSTSRAHEHSRGHGAHCRLPASPPCPASAPRQGFLSILAIFLGCSSTPGPYPDLRNPHQWCSFEEKQWGRVGSLQPRVSRSVIPGG